MKFCQALCYLTRISPPCQTQLNQNKLHQSVNKKHEVARQVTDLEAIFHKYDGAEGRYANKEKRYKKDFYDLLEYVKWITS